MSELVDDVDRLLRESIQAHEAARTARLTHMPHARAFLERARDLRYQALELDPDMTTKAWQNEAARLGSNVHPALLEFYQAKAPR